MVKPRYQDIEPEAVPVVELAGWHPGEGAGRQLQRRDRPGPTRWRRTRSISTSRCGGNVAQRAGAGRAQCVRLSVEGGVTIGEGSTAKAIARGEIAVLGLGPQVRVAADKGPARLILVAGKPLREPVAKYGPFVMNTAEEIHQANRRLSVRALRLMSSPKGLSEITSYHAHIYFDAAERPRAEKLRALIAERFNRAGRVVA
jgi:redox-sensitive bicupin YhaK (pirin superfamily)